MITMNNIPLAIIFVVGAVLLAILPHRVRPVAYLAIPALAFYFLLHLEPGVSLNFHFLNYELVPYRVDRLSLVFGYVFVIMGFVGGVYSFHVKDKLQQVSSLLYVGSSLGVVFAGDLFTLLVFWEIMAVSSVCLIWARRRPKSNRAGFRYLLVHIFGGSMLMAGIILHYNQTGSMLFNHFEGGIASYLILFSFALNAAVPPLHAWLTDAYPEGTVTGSVFLSAFTTKVAIYALARGFAGLEVLIWAGIIMAIYGVVFAVLENDIRRLLAYHIISQVGYMVFAIGLGTEMAINGATAHAFSHIMYKSLLFMGVGTVIYATGESKLTRLGGLARAMPLALGLYMVGAFSISGFPLFSGFVSKSMVIHGAEIEHMAAAALLLSLASVGTFLHTGLKLPYFTWFGNSRLLKPLKPRPVPRCMYIGMALTAGICITIGVQPALLYNLLPFTVHYQPYTASHVMQTMQLLIFTGLGFWLLIGKLGGEAKITLDTDWFYRRPSRLAYTVFSVSICRFFGVVEKLSLSLVRFITKLSANPPGYLVELVMTAKYAFLRTEKPAPEPATFNPDRYRIPLGVMVLVVLLGLIILLAWDIFI
ncbi:Na(+)/H(+) antiporter subunit D [Chloroflexota bacterium]